MFVSKSKFEELQREFVSLKNRLQDQSENIEKVLEIHKKTLAAFETLQNMNVERDAHYKEIDAKVRELYDIRERKLSDEPWVEVIGGDVDPERGLQMRLDWNDAFIEQLRAQGYRGTSESTLVGQWLLNVSNTVTDGGDGA